LFGAFCQFLQQKASNITFLNIQSSKNDKITIKIHKPGFRSAENGNFNGRFCRFGAVFKQKKHKKAQMSAFIYINHLKSSENHYTQNRYNKLINIYQ
jgi:hypothetical protein